MSGKASFNYFTLIYLPYLLVLTAAFVLFIIFEHLRFYEIIKNNERLQIELTQKGIYRDFDFILPDIEVLANERHVQAFILDFDDSRRRRLVAEELASFARQKRQYRSIRLVGLDGSELVRVDYRNNTSSIAPGATLKNSSSAEYFRQTLGLGPSELYISPISLARHNGSIETPHAPTIRFAMPVYDAQNNKKAILVLDYSARKLLEHFDEMLAGSHGHIALLNQDGYWIRSHKEEREWGFMFDRKDLRFQNAHPDEWDIIRTSRSGQMLTRDGLFTFASVYPINLIGGYQPSGTEGQHASHSHIDPELNVWKIISDVPAKTVYRSIYDQLFGLAGGIWLLLVITGLFVTRHLAVNFQERRQLRNQIELHSQIYRNSTDGVIITDADQKIIDANDAFLDICGYSFDEIVGRNPSMFSSGRHGPDFYREMRESLKSSGHWEGEIYNRHKNGSVYTEWIRITRIEDDAGKTSHYIALVSDITHKKSNEEMLLKHAHHDPLTGAHNRLSFDERFDHELSLARRNKRKLALLYFDLDDFKPINDEYGHQAGDLVLQSVVDRIQNNIRDTDTLARLGGDEFAVILQEILADEDAEKVANTLCYIVSEPIYFENMKLCVRASAGIAIYPIHGNTQQQLLHFADQQMYNNKSKKKNGTKAIKVDVSNL